MSLLMLGNKKLPRNGLIGEWLMNEGTGQTLTDKSISGVDMWLGSTSAADTNDPTWATGYLTLDGVDDFLRQKYEAIQSGTVLVSTANGVAFLSDSSQTFTPYAGVAGSDKNYYVVVQDASNRVAWGYLGETLSGESLNTELNYNGNLELGNTNGWDKYFNAGAEAAGTIAVDNTVTYSGTYSLKVTITNDGNTSTDININNITASGGFSFTAGKLYKFVFAIKGDAAKTIRITIRQQSSPYTICGFDSSTINVTTDWVLQTIYFTSTQTIANNVGINFYFGNKELSTVYIDAVSLQEVLVPANGIKLYSTKSGSTQNMKEVNASFSYSGTCTYEIRKSNFQSLSAFTVCGWVNGAAQDTKYIFSKGDIGVSNRSIAVLTGTGATTANMRVRVSQDGGDTNIKDYKSSLTLLNSTWNFWMVTWDGTTLKLYVNSILDSSPTKVLNVAITGLFDSFSQIRFGAIGSSTTAANFLGASISYFPIWNRALSASEGMKVFTYTRNYLRGKGLTI